MIENLRDEILNWYKINGRSLPWRETKDPYKVWLSEIILQQTRVKQGMPYYEKFVSTYPNVVNLANASEQEVLKLWQGLGYYSRARNLHAAAKYVAFELGGVFPTTYAELIRLNGVGAYTAAAIASIAFNEPKAVLDGNVYRVLARLFNIDDDIAASASRAKFQNLADELLDKTDPSTFNQAIMDFGALQCAPKAICVTCTLQGLCKAQALGKVDVLPVKINKLKRKKRYFNYFLLIEDETILLKQRTEKDIWQNLYELPLIESQSKTVNDFSQLLTGAEKPILISEKVHKLTHQDIITSFFSVKSIKNDGEYMKVSLAELDKFPLPRLIDEFLQVEIK